MEIKLSIPPERIADMMTSAMESGDPVTTAARGGWCNGIKLLRGGSARGCWYAKPEIYKGNFLLEVIEVDDETTGHETKHRIAAEHMRRGLAVMAVKYPRQFGQILENNTDAPCADLFLQCTLFGEEKYC